MISTILIWIYIFLLTTVIGHLLFRICIHLIKSDIKSDPSFAELSIFGIAGIGTFLSYFSIFYKTGLFSNVILVIIGLIYILLKPKEMLSYFKRQIQKSTQFSITLKLVLLLYFVLLLLAAQTYPKIADTGLYHAQFIQWIANFKAIPGLGNLHGRFAFNNQSFLLESLFSLSFLKLRTFHLVNSYLLLIMSVSLILTIQRTIQSNRFRSVLYTGLIVLLQVFYLVSASSPTPDIFTTAGICFIVMTYLERIASQSNNKIYRVILIITSFFLVTVKLSSLPIVLLVFLYLPEPDSTLLRKLYLIIIPGVIVFTPFCIRNYIISGYLIYPYPFINLFNPDWKIPLSYVYEMKSVISTHAQAGDWQIRPFSEWLPIWFSNLSTGFKTLSLFILLSPLLTITIVAFRRSIRDFFKSELRILVICFPAIIFWFFSAPNYRFIYGFLFVYLLITGMILLYYLVCESGLSGFFNRYKEKFLKFYFVRLIYALIIFSPFVFFLKYDFREIKKYIMFPVDYKEVTFKTVTINNFQVRIPEDNTYCWNMPVPCSVIQNNIGITNIGLRGKDLKDGFRVIN
jgi:hypothetical protein